MRHKLILLIVVALAILLGVVVNGEVKSVATIRSPFYDSAQIAGRFTKESAEDLAHILNTGPLPAPLTIVKEEIN